MVKQIKRNSEAKRTVETDFILAHNVSARAEIPPTDKVELFIMICKIWKNLNFLSYFKVSLWLGANVMLEYSLDQAEDLLTKNFNQANLTMEQADTDLDFLKYFFSH